MLQTDEWGILVCPLKASWYIILALMLISVKRQSGVLYMYRRER